MSKLQRRLLLLFFFLLFLITVPLVILFVQGYRFDHDSGIFVYSGSIAIKSWPKDIDIFLNGKKYSEKKGSLINETFVLNGLKPGKYQLRCQKDDFSYWEKNIEVHSGISTEFWNVLLFPLPEKLERVAYPFTQGTERFFLSPRDNNELIFSYKENERNIFKILNTKTKQAEEIFSSNSDKEILPQPEDKENVEWSSDKQALLLPFRTPSGEKEYYIGKIRKNQLENPVRLSSIFFPLISNNNKKQKAEVNNEIENFEKVRWMFDKNNEVVILTRKHELFYFNVENQDETILLAENVSDFDFAGNRIYYSQNPNNLVWEIRDNDVSTRRQITKTAFLSGKEDDFITLRVYDEYRLTMINSLGNLFVFNQEKEKNETVSEEFQGEFIDSQFSNDGKKLLFWSKNELWVFFLRDWEVQPIREKGKKELIARFSQPIRNVQWMENYENVLFTTGKWLKSAEIDDRSRINITDILKKDEDWQENQVIYNKGNQVAFYLDKLNDSNKAIYSSLLLDKKGLFGF